MPFFFQVETIRAILKKELNLPVYEIADSRACLDGGDVLFTGREFFVGISNRTNERGAMALASAFPEYPVTPIRVPSKFLHLKSCISMAGPDILCISSSPEARDVLRVSAMGFPIAISLSTPIAFFLLYSQEIGKRSHI